MVKRPHIAAINSFLKLYNVAVYTHTTFCLALISSGTPGLHSDFTSMSDAAKNARVQIPLQELTFSSLGHASRSRLAGQYI